MRTAYTLGLIASVWIASAAAGQTESNSLESYLRLHYNKQEQMVPMRDGVKLFTSIFVPRDNTRKYPILMKRTPTSFSDANCSQLNLSATCGKIVFWRSWSGHRAAANPHWCGPG